MALCFFNGLSFYSNQSSVNNEVENSVSHMLSPLLCLPIVLFLKHMLRSESLLVVEDAVSSKKYCSGQFHVIRRAQEFFAGLGLYTDKIITEKQRKYNILIRKSFFCPYFEKLCFKTNKNHIFYLDRQQNGKISFALCSIVNKSKRRQDAKSCHLKNISSNWKNRCLNLRHARIRQNWAHCWRNLFLNSAHRETSGINGNIPDRAALG